MAKYTTLVRSVCEVNSGMEESGNYADINTIIANSWKKIFENFPIFDEAYREVICTKILKHYYMREICAETVGLWKLWLNEKMELIMPYYNQLYKSELLKFNPMYDVDISTSGNKEGSGNSNGTDNRTYGENGTVNSSSDSWNTFQDTPQGGLEGITEETYLTSATHDKGVSGSTSERSSTDNNVSENRYSNMDSYTEKISGKRGGQSYSKMLTEFRETFLNIDNMIINELGELFMTIY